MKDIKYEKCHFLNKYRHFTKDCLKRKGQFEKKCKPSALVCFESNLAEVHYNVWWIDSGYTTYVSNMMHGFFTIQIINPNEKFIFMGNRVKALVESIGTYCLILDTKHHLDPFQTPYVPSVSCKLISLSKLDFVGYSFTFGN